MLKNIFTTILNMSITASAAVILIICFRALFGKKLPKTFNYAIWIIVLIRLLIPFSIKSAFSIFNVIPDNAASVKISGSTVLSNNISYEQIYENLSKRSTNTIPGNSSPSVTIPESESPLQILTLTASIIWLTGSFTIFLICILLYLHGLGKFKDAVLYAQSDLALECSRKLNLKRMIKIYTSDKLCSPVVCGLSNTRIIIPLSISKSCSESELKHIITHELIHIKRFDYLFKPLSVLALCIHWFNPIIWVSFLLSQKDMEMSCDEKVISVYDDDVRKEYASSLIKLASKQNILLNGGLLAFGESNIKSRIKGIMKFKKPGTIIGAAAVLIVIVLGILLLTNRLNAKDEIDSSIITNSKTGQSAENTLTPAPSEIQTKEDNQNGEITFTQMLGSSLISPSVPEKIKPLLLKRIKTMKEMNAGVGPWEIIYYTNEKLIIYNYAHIAAIDISEKNKGIYSIIELKDLKVGSYQGSEIAMIYPSPDALACVLGTGSFEKDNKPDKSLYLCNLYDSSVKEIRKDFNLGGSTIAWYRNLPSSAMLPYYISISSKTNPESKMIWDIEKSKELSSIASGTKEEPVTTSFKENIDLNTGYYYNYWWLKDKDTVIGAPYKNIPSSSSEELRLSDFEIIEVNTKNKTGKILFKILD